MREESSYEISNVTGERVCSTKEVTLVSAYDVCVCVRSSVLVSVCVTVIKKCHLSYLFTSLILCVCLCACPHVCYQCFISEGEINVF